MPSYLELERAKESTCIYRGKFSIILDFACAIDLIIQSVLKVLTHPQDVWIVVTDEIDLGGINSDLLQVIYYCSLVIENLQYGLAAAIRAQVSYLIISQSKIGIGEISAVKSGENKKVVYSDPRLSFEPFKQKSTSSVSVQTEDTALTALDTYVSPSIFYTPSSASESAAGVPELPKPCEKVEAIQEIEPLELTQQNGKEEYIRGTTKKSSTGKVSLYKKTPQGNFLMVLKAPHFSKKNSETFFYFERGGNLASMSYVLPEGNQVLYLDSLYASEGCLNHTLLVVLRTETDPKNPEGPKITKVLFHVVLNDINKSKDLIQSKALPDQHFSNFLRLKNTTNELNKFFDILFLINDHELLYFRSNHSNSNWTKDISKNFTIYKDPANGGMRRIVDFQFATDGAEERKHQNRVQFAILSNFEGSGFLSFFEVGEIESTQEKVRKLPFEVPLQEPLSSFELKTFVCSTKYSRVILLGEKGPEAYVGDLKIPGLSQVLEQSKVKTDKPKAIQHDLEVYKCQGPTRKNDAPIQGGRVELTERVEEVGAKKEKEWTIAACLEAPNILAVISASLDLKQPLVIKMMHMNEVDSDIGGANSSARMRGVAFSEENVNNDKDRFVNTSVAISDGRIKNIFVRK